MEVNTYTKLDTTRFEKHVPKKIIFFWVVVLFFLSLLIGYFGSAYILPSPTISRLNLQRLTLHGAANKDRSKTTLNATDIANKNIQDHMVAPDTIVLPQIKSPGKNSQIYIVKKNDNLWTIAEKMYGDGFKATEIAEVNKIVNKNVIFAGQKLSIPAINKISRSTQTSKPASNTVQTNDTQIMAANTKNTDTVQKYTVVKGDNLWRIATEFYGDGFQWHRIAKANNLKHPQLIHAGNVLSVPSL